MLGVLPGNTVSPGNTVLPGNTELSRSVSGEKRGRQINNNRAPNLNRAGIIRNNPATLFIDCFDEGTDFVCKLIPLNYKETKFTTASKYKGPIKGTQFQTTKTKSMSDTRHDFKSFSQDTPSQKRGQNFIDYFSGFSNNIQREVLGMEPIYSQKFTAATNQCSDNLPLGNGPEEISRQLYETAYDVEKTQIKFNDYGGDIEAFHKAIYELLLSNFSQSSRASLIDGPSGKLIPVIVDTQGTLEKDAGNYFVVCRPKECVADPSNTSKRVFPQLLIENGEGVRSYTINNVRHTVKGPLSSPDIDFTIGGLTYTYNFDTTMKRKPNEIEVCKGKIKDKIAQIMKGKEQPITVGAEDIISTYCANYDLIKYDSTKLTPSDKNEIALPYIAKRAGDQLQVLCCRQPINYIDKGGNTYTVQNKIFWSQDIEAVCAGIMNEQTCVFQHIFTKDVTIYFGQDYDPFVTSSSGLIRTEGGASCTRAQLKDGLTKNFPVNDNCYLLTMLSLTDNYSEKYDPYSALNLLFYYASSRPEPGEFDPFKYIKEQSNNFALSLDQCFYIPKKEDSKNKKIQTPLTMSNDAPPPLYYIKTDELRVYRNEYNEFVFEKDGYKPIVKDIYSIYNILFLNDTNEEALEAARADGGSRRRQRGGANKLTTAWINHLDASSVNETLFIDFFQMIASFEDRYFFHADYTDGIFMEDPSADVRIGGYVQVELMCFLGSFLENFKKFRGTNLTEFQKLLTAFKYFPNFLSTNDPQILADLNKFCQCWEDISFPVKEKGLPGDVIKTTLIQILKEAFFKSQSIRFEATGDDKSIAQVLHEYFPLGYFNAQLIEIKKLVLIPLPSVSKTASATPSLSPAAPEVSKGKIYINVFGRPTVPQGSSFNPLFKSGQKTRGGNRTKHRITRKSSQTRRSRTFKILRQRRGSFRVSRGK